MSPFSGAQAKPGPRGGPRTFQAQPPAPGSDRGGRPATATASTPPAPVAPQMDPLLLRFGKFPSMGNPMGPRPKIVPGMPAYNPFERRWIEDEE